MTVTEEEKLPIAYEVTSSIKQELGDDFLLSEFITPDKIQSCALLLKQASDEFFTEALADLVHLEQLLAIDPEPNELRQFQIYIQNIQAFAKVLGFTLITEICVHSVVAINNDRLTLEKKRGLIKKLVETLRLAFDQRIRDDGGAIGKAILESLRKLG
jgi:hypothetical protein